MALAVDTTPGVLRYDPQGHQLGPLGTIATQVSLMAGLIWAMGAVGALLLPPTYGILIIVPVLGAFLLAPRSVLLQFPVSFSIVGIFSITIASIAWTVDATATVAQLKGIVPAMLAIVLAGGLLTLRDLKDALIWAVRIVLVITVIAILVLPQARIHLDAGSTIDGYPGWHGLFNHKNNMSAFIVFAIPTVLTFHRPGVVKLSTLGVMGVLLVGSTSATGLSAAFVAGMAWLWLRVYQSQRDARNSTLLFFVSVLGLVGVLAGALSSIATITSAYGKDTTFSGRTEIWNASYDALLRRPWLGHGFGGLFWTENLSNETAQIWRQVGFEAAHAHNGALDLALQIGLIGLAIFAVLWLSLFSNGWRSLRRRPNLGVWIVSFMVGNLVMSISEDVFYGGWIAIFALMKMLLMRRDESLDRPSYLDGPIAKWAQRQPHR